jgi:hypothetical protein
MAEFKPMTKMETTEPSVILKLKAGGHVNMKKGGKAESGHKKMADGGAAIPSGALQALMQNPALVGRPAVNALVRSPGKPSMAARRAAMMASMAARRPAPAAPMMSAAGPGAMPGAMKKGGRAEGCDADMAQDKAMIKKAFKQHDTQEHKGGKGTQLALKKGGKMADGGIAEKGGVKENDKTSSSKTTKIHEAGQTGYANFKRGGVINSSEKGGIQENDKVTKSQTTKIHEAGVNPGYEAFKKGGKAKKAYATGGRVESGAPVAMPQSSKPVPKPIRINQLTGTYKKGGCVKMKDGGDLPPPKDMSKGAYDRFYADEKADNEAMSNAILGFPGRMVDKVKSLFSSDKTPPTGSVTKTEKSVTVAPGKKRGGRC